LLLSAIRSFTAEASDRENPTVQRVTAFAVDDICAECKRLKGLGVAFAEMIRFARSNALLA